MKEQAKPAPGNLFPKPKFYRGAEAMSKLFARFQEDEAKGEEDLVKWLSGGIGQSKSCHQDLAFDLKKAYGMRVRKTPA